MLEVTRRRCNVTLSPHYYVLSLGPGKSALFEAFRDSLIEIENHGFPVVAPAMTSDQDCHEHLRKFAGTVDKCFGHNYRFEPLRLVLVGDKEISSAFLALTAHRSAVIGVVECDHSATRARELGQIAWPVVKGAMSGVVDQAMLDLEASAGRGHIAAGLEAVVKLVRKGLRATLLVEDGYHMRGSIAGTDQEPVISPDVDVREANDDAVDVVIEKVLESGGNVVFTPSGTLSDRNRIVLLLRGAAVL
jgi:hypothetical protein